MSKTSILFALKCSVILYFAACSNIEQFAVTKPATPDITQGTWKVNLFMDVNNDNTNDLAGYTFKFNTSGDLLAIKNDVEVKGHWTEDDLSKRVTLNLTTADPVLEKLNNSWMITSAGNAQVGFQKKGDAAAGHLNIISL